MLFEEHSSTLFCSDLFHQFGDGMVLTESDLIGSTTAALEQMLQGPSPDICPAPPTLAVMHGSSFRGEVAPLLLELASVLKTVLT